MAPEKTNKRDLLSEIEDYRNKIGIIEEQLKSSQNEFTLRIEKNKARREELTEQNQLLREQQQELSENNKDNGLLFGHIRQSDGSQEVRKEIKIMTIKTKLVAKTASRELLEEKLSKLKRTYEMEAKLENEADGEAVRLLENKLDKMRAKSDEANHIKRCYDQVLHSMATQADQFQDSLESMEKQLKKYKMDLKQMRAQQQQAVRASHVTHAELREAEHKALVDRSRRHSEINALKIKMGSLNIKQPTNVTTRNKTELDITSDEKRPVTSQVLLSQVSKLEHDHRLIQTKMGASTSQGVIDRLENQNEAKHELENQKEFLDQTADDLKQELEALTMKLNEFKFREEYKAKSGAKVIEQYHKHLDDNREQLESNQKQQIKASNKLMAIENGIDHLCMLLSTHKLPNGINEEKFLSTPGVHAAILKLALVKEKLATLSDELTEEDYIQYKESLKQEARLLGSNVRIKFQSPADMDFLYQDESSSDDDVTASSREKVKAESLKLLAVKEGMRKRRRIRQY